MFGRTTTYIVDFFLLSVNDLSELTRSIICHSTVLQIYLSVSMSLNDVWEAAAANPFHPVVSKDWQFSLGFTLLLIGTV